MLCYVVNRKEAVLCCTEERSLLCGKEEENCVV
jgi:hypothetical protein